MYSGPKYEFAQADGTVTVDLIDVSPRPPGQAAAVPERWQFTKETLKNLKTSHETIGKFYVLFLPWPTYKPDITRVRISVRYDADTGGTLYCTPSTITIDTGGPPNASTPGEVNTSAFRPPPQSFGPPGAVTPAGGAMPFGGGAYAPVPNGPMMPMAPSPGSMPIAPLPHGLQPIVMTIGRP